MTTNMTPEVRPPDGTIHVGDWEQDPAGHRASTLRGSAHENADVQVDGRQHDDGRVEIGVSIWTDVHELTAAQARGLAADPVAAADALDSLR